MPGRGLAPSFSGAESIRSVLAPQSQLCARSCYQQLSGDEMSEESIPADLRDFIVRYIDSVAQLEALLLLYWEKSTNWTANKLSKRLYISDAEALVLLSRLTADGLAVAADGQFSFRPKLPEHEEMLEQLASAYSTRLIPVTNLIHSKPPRIREFSDAFRIRKDRT